MPPMNCERAVFGLMIAPGREHAEQARDADLAGVGVDAHLGELRAEARGARASSAALIVLARCRTRRPRSLAARSSSALAGACTTAVPQDAVPIEPPATGAREVASRRSRRAPRSTVDAERVGGDLGEHGARAGADVGGGDLDGVTAVGARRARSPARASGRPGRSTRRRRCRSASAPSRRAPARVAVRPAEALGALAQAGDEVARAERDAASRGRRRARCGSAARSGRGRRRSRARRSPTRARTCPGTRRARASTTASGTSRRDEPVAWCGGSGAAYIMRVGVRGLLGELARASRSARTPRGRSR